ncbi:MAG: hypothetical protein ACK55Z_13155 [bacterium]
MLEPDCKCFADTGHGGFTAAPRSTEVSSVKLKIDCFVLHSSSKVER